MKEKLNIKEKIEGFLSPSYFIDSNFNKSNFEEFFKGLSSEKLEFIIARVRDTHSSYRMSYDKFQALLIGIVLTTVITLVLLLIDFLISFNSIILIGIILILFISCVFFLIFIQKYRFTKKRQVNLKRKKEIITNLITEEISGK